MNTTGHYGPMIIACNREYKVGDKVDSVKILDVYTTQPIIIIREAAKEEYISTCRERGLDDKRINIVTSRNIKYYEAHTD